MPKGRPPKYEPLRAYLAAQPPNVAELTLTFAEVEAIVGAPLPPTARTRDFWTNHRAMFRSAPQTRAWRAAGWRVAGIALWKRAPAVTFARGAPPVSQPADARPRRDID